MKSRIVVTTICLFLLSCCVSTSPAAEQNKKTNILLIMADDLGYGDLGCYGAKDMSTPNLDRLALDGMKFTNFYANCPVCSPTRASLLTGCYPDRAGVPGVIRTHPENDWGYLNTRIPTLPALLKKQGYRTAHIGKWHLGLESPNTPNERGFDYFHGWLGDMMDDYFTHRRHDINYMRHNDQVIDPEGHATDLFSEWAADFLKQQRNEDDPFFLYLAYNAPHTPIQPPEDWVRKVKQRQTGISDKRAKLVALIEHMDAGIGQVLQAFEVATLADNTLVFFTSDNGGQLNVGANNGPLRDGKTSMYEGGLKVPTIVRWPGQTSINEITSFEAATMDAFPTILEIAGGEIPSHIDGQTIIPTLQGKAQEKLRDETYFVRREGGFSYGGKTIEALRFGDWKLVQNFPYQPLELFNLKADPLEENDLARSRPKITRDLSARLRKHIQRGATVPWQNPKLFAK